MQLDTFFTLSQQTAQFFLSIAAGAVLGTAYDIFRALRIIFPFARKKSIVCICDIVFMIICGVTVFAFSFLFCRGQVRLFCIIGAMLGFILYLLSLGSIVTGILRVIVSAVCKLLQKVYSLIFAPAVKLIYPKKNKLFVHSYENDEK